MILLFSIALLCFAVPASAGETLANSVSAYHFNDATGSVSDIRFLPSGKRVVTAVCNSYLLMAHGEKDITAFEAQDRVIEKKKNGGSICYRCVNPLLPGLVISKRYWLENNGLRRELTFQNQDSRKRYLIPFTRVAFAPEFKRDSFWFGAGYLGPFIPAPQVTKETKVDKYVQSSKGMVLIHSDPGKGSFANYRVKINDTVVYPWWQSTIGRYREQEDRLYYTPDGWRMSLGCLDLPPDDGSIRYTDVLTVFSGNLFTFFSEILGKDRDFQEALAAIPPVAPEADDLSYILSMSANDVARHHTEMLDEGKVVYLANLLGSWGDYRAREDNRGWCGGRISTKELHDFFQSIRNISPRFLTANYGITVAANHSAPILAEKPEWFRMLDRQGRRDSLFPGLSENFQSMMNLPEVRDFYMNSLLGMANDLGNRMVYIDEAQQNNTINWQRDELIRDDHLVMFWDKLRRRAREEGKLLFFNGSGQPFADLNYMENARMMAPENWREYAGVALGLELFSAFRPHSRISPLYWEPTTVNDYSNRFLALGWVPAFQYDGEQPLAPVRAAYETGNADPVDVHYTPDWKSDPETNVESYAMRRLGTDDILVSFINRNRTAVSQEFTLDLASLKFPEEQRINIWAMPVKRYGKDRKEYFLSNRDYRELYRKNNWQGGFIGAPELVYSGPARGVFRHTRRDWQRDQMIQFVITPSPLSIFSENSLPCNYFYTKSRHTAISGSTVTTQREAVEILLADRNCFFASVEVDGKKVTPRPVDVGGQLFQLITLPAGTHHIRWEKENRKPAAVHAVPAADVADGRRIRVSSGDSSQLYAVEFEGRTVYTGTLPAELPGRHPGGIYRLRFAGEPDQYREFRLPEGVPGSVAPVASPKRHPAQRNVVPADVKYQNVSISAGATYVSDWDDAFDLQRNQLPYIVGANPQALELKAGTSPRERGNFVSLYVNTCAGFELSGARQIELKLKNTFSDNPAQFKGHVMYNYRNPALDFAGFVIDYRVGGKYTYRVTCSVGLYSDKLRNPLPPWGCGRVQDRAYDLGQLVDERAEHVFSLDLARMAPKNWDGTVFFSVGTSRLNPNRLLDVKILSFNRADAGNFLEPLEGRAGLPDMLHLPKLLYSPRSLQKPVPSEWRNWSRTTPLRALSMTKNPVTQQTWGYLAYDDRYCYLGVIGEERARKVLADDPYNIWKNDCIEAYWERPDGSVYQLVADVRGAKRAGVNYKGVNCDEVKVSSRVMPGKGFVIFIAVPWTTLKVDSPDAGKKIKFNLCRSRQGREPEYGNWGLGERRYAEPENFGTLMLGLFNAGQGRAEEILLRK